VGSRYDGVGRIIFVCSKCNFVVHRYALGDPNNKSKYMGAPTPEQALSGIDDLMCPGCDRKLRFRPRSIEILSKAEFEAKYIDFLFRLIPRSQVQMLEAAEGAATQAAGT